MADKLVKPTLDGDAFNKLFRDVNETQSELDSANGRHRNNLKRLDKAGCHMKALAWARQVAKLSETEARSLLTSFFSICGWLDLGVVKQRDLFETASKAKADPSEIGATRTQAAELAGLQHGRKGGTSADCTYKLGSEVHAAWMRGLIRGSDEFDKTGGERRKKPASTSRKRPSKDDLDQPTLGNA